MPRQSRYPYRNFVAEFLGGTLASKMSESLSIKSRPNLLSATSETGALVVPLFQGDQRERARALLAAKIMERQVMSVLQLVNKDPSLALATVPLKLTNGGVSRIEEVDFAFACMQNDILPGCVFAINAGYSIDTTNSNGRSLLDLAISKMVNGGVEPTVGMLLAMGIDPNGASNLTETEPGTFAIAMQHAYPPAIKTKSGLSESKTQHPGVITMLLDAKANPVYPSNFKCPILILVGSDGWSDPVVAAEHTMMMARLVKGGSSLNRASGSPLMTPLQLALGSKNGNAIVSLIRVGADATSVALKGKDLFALVDAHNLQEFKPAIQSALMERVIAKSVGTGPSSAKKSDDGTGEPRQKRRMGVI